MSAPASDGKPTGALDRLALVLGAGLGSGFSPVAPGTAGSLLAAVLYLPLRPYFAGPRWPVGLALVGVVTLVGVWSAGVIERSLGKKDPGRVVIDEVAGQWLAFLAVPFSWPLWGAGFFIFRFMDIVKPFPARWMERLPGGWGIMLDDLVAGAYTLIILHVLARWGL